jgi:hypothetical protein
MKAIINWFKNRYKNDAMTMKLNDPIEDLLVVIIVVTLIYCFIY